MGSASETAQERVPSVNDQQTESIWEKIKASAGEYPIEAFGFIQDGLRHTVERLADQEDRDPSEGRHVSGQELCLGLRDYALDQYGLLAGTVLEGWRIRTTEDFGRLVFALVDAGVLRKSGRRRLRRIHRSR